MENNQRRLDEARQAAEADKARAVEEATKRAQANAEIERTRQVNEILSNMENAKQRFLTMVTKEYETREKQAELRAADKAKAEVEAKYELLTKTRIEKTEAAKDAHTERVLAEQKEKYDIKLAEVQDSIRDEAVVKVREELERDFKERELLAAAERKKAVDEAHEAATAAASARYEEKVRAVLEAQAQASQAEKGKAIEEALEKAVGDAQKRFDLELERFQAAKDAAIEEALHKHGRDKAQALEAQKAECMEKVSILESQLDEVISESELQQIKWDEEVEEIKAATRKECAEQYAASLQETKEQADRRVACAEEETEQYKELFYSESQARKKLHNRLVELQGNIRVFCRVRPMVDVEASSGEAGRRSVVGFPQEDVLTVSQRRGPSAGDDFATIMRYEFDRTFAMDSTQEQVFEAVQPLIVSVLDGYNGCIFAYGQTGSGKTHTMEGPPSDPGVNNRAIAELFARRRERSDMFDFEFHVTMLEIYNEEIRDLLADANASKPQKKLEIRMAEKGGYEIPGITKIPVASETEVQQAISKGSSNRTVGQHNMNEHSSRSHLVLTFYALVVSKRDGAISRAKLHLIDLAGSERISKVKPHATSITLRNCNFIHVAPNYKLIQLIDGCSRAAA